jgi:hypothetical protein
LKGVGGWGGRSGGQLKLQCLMSYGLCTLILVAGCSHPIPSASNTGLVAQTCAAGDTVLVRETLYFGRNRPGGGTVSDTEWSVFLAEVLTPRFPAGLTVLEATGQWQGATGTVEHERSEIVTIFHPDTEAARRSAREVAQEYRQRFQQEAVLRESERTCARFE